MTPNATTNERSETMEPAVVAAGAGGRRARRQRPRLSRQQRRELVACFEQSGFSAARFARQAGVSSSSLLRWRRRLAGGPESGTSPAAGFAQVHVMPVSAACQEPVVLRLEQAGVSVSVPPGTDTHWLGRLLGCLREGA